MKDYNVPSGFELLALEAAVKKSGRKDIAIICSKRPCTMAGVFTKNTFKSPSVIFNMELIKSGSGRAIIANSGNANACTGERGYEDAREIAQTVIEALKLPQGSVYVCSTGIIGIPLPMERITPAINANIHKLGSSTIADLAEAIMTTDTFPKIVSKEVSINGVRGTIAGIAKGAGMISPDMATMLSFIVTDIAVEHTALDRALRDAVDNSFNIITVDADMSTNDTVLIMSNGAAGNVPVRDATPEYDRFYETLASVAYELAEMIVRDGEGATKLVKVRVNGAGSADGAKVIARKVADSLLVKTAIYGKDPNWGRIVAAMGSSGVPFDSKRVDIYIGGVKVVEDSLRTGREDEAKGAMDGSELEILIDLKEKDGFSADILTCDLTEKYIEINAEYTT